jgi:predicted lipid-binding transport protein (Tim44 family)
MTTQTLKRHPIRGFIWGLVAGLGLGLLLMVLSIVPLSIPTLAMYTGVTAVLGLVWGIVGPAKKPKGPAPAAARSAPPAAETMADDSAPDAD